MALLDIRRRVGYLFLAVTVGQIILISAQVQSKRGVPVLEAVTFGFFAEVQRATSAASSFVRDLWSGYVALRGVHEENERLTRALADARVYAQEQHALADRARGLERLMALRESVPLQTLAARVMAIGRTQTYRTITIDRGTLDGVAVPMAVIAPAGIVGRIVTASPRASKVMLLVDGSLGIAVLDERSRAEAIAFGADDRLKLQDDRLMRLDEGLRLQYVSEVADIVVGDTVLSSGIDGVFPKGLAVGRVETVVKSGGGYKEVTISPAVDFSKLEEVLVVLTRPPAPDVPEDGQP